jgi:DNA primase
MLADLPDPHGALFRWLESQIHEHGAQPWASLRAAMQDQPFCELAERRMSPESIHHLVESAETEAVESTLGGLLSVMRELRLDWLESEAKAAAANSQLDRLRSLTQELAALKKKT